VASPARDRGAGPFVSILIAVLVVLLLVAVVAVISGPLRSAAAGSRGEGRRHADAAPGAAKGERDPHPPRAEREREALAAELEAAREAKYQEIRDAELDYRTGKLSQADFEAVDAALRAEAIEILDRIAVIEGD